MKSIIPFFLFMFCVLLSGYSQDDAYVEDFEFWSSISISKSFSKKFEIGFKEAARFDNNAGEYKLSFSELSAKYTINKRLSFTGSYRNTHRAEDIFNHRLTISSRIREKIKRFDLSYRIRFDKDWKSANISDNTVRNKLQLKYNPRKKDYSFYAASELFYLKNYKFSDFDKMRYKLGAEYELSKKLEIDLSYMIQNELNQSSPQKDFVLGLSLSYKL